MSELSLWKELASHVLFVCCLVGASQEQLLGPCRFTGGRTGSVQALLKTSCSALWNLSTMGNKRKNYFKYELAGEYSKVFLYSLFRYIAT